MLFCFCNRQLFHACCYQCCDLLANRQEEFAAQDSKFSIFFSTLRCSYAARTRARLQNRGAHREFIAPTRATNHDAVSSARDIVGNLRRSAQGKIAVRIVQQEIAVFWFKNSIISQICRRAERRSSTRSRSVRIRARRMRVKIRRLPRGDFKVERLAIVRVNYCCAACAASRHAKRKRFLLST